MREAELGLKHAGDILVPAELLAVVGGDRVRQVDQRRQQAQRGVDHVVRAGRRQRGEQDAARLASALS